MITTLIALTLSSAFAADVPAQCVGKSGAALTLCVQQAELDAVKKQLAELAEKCEDACDNSAPAAPRASAPVKTPRLDALEKRVAELEEQLAALPEGADTSGLEAEIGELAEQLDALTKRVDELESHPTAIPGPPPPAVEPIPGPRGADGEDGRDGRDGRPAEVSTTVGVAGFHSPEWNLIGGTVELRLGGRPTHWLAVGGYGEGILLGVNDLGYSVGGYASFEVTHWFAPGLAVGWSEVGIDLASDGAHGGVVQGIEGAACLELRPTRAWVIEGNLGAHFGAEETAFVWGVSTGLRF